MVNWFNKNKEYGMPEGNPLSWTPRQVKHWLKHNLLHDLAPVFALYDGKVRPRISQTRVCWCYCGWPAWGGRRQKPAQASHRPRMDFAGPLDSMRYARCQNCVVPTCNALCM
jgi:hypothetical protein